MLHQNGPTYRSTCLLRRLQASNRSTATWFSEMRSRSRLIVWRVLVKFVAAIEAAAMLFLMLSFSASRLNGFAFLDFLSFSLAFLSLFLFEWVNDWIWPVIWVPEREDALRVWDEDCGFEGPAFGSSSSSSPPKGFSVSLRTLDFSCVTACLRLGNS